MVTQTEPGRRSPQRCKRILALDGGGVRGALSVAFLERLEKLYSDNAKDYRPIRLSDSFDLVGGTSTGSIIGAALALGLSTADIKDLYFFIGPRIFRRPRFRVPWLQTKFDSQSLKEEIDRV